MQRFIRHVQALWPPLDQTGLRGRLGRWRWLLAVLPFIAWAGYCFAIGERRWDHAAIVSFLPALAWTSPTTRKLFLGLRPLALTGVAYDALRFLKNIGLAPTEVHTCDLERLDARLFLGPGGQSWPAWFLAHGNLGWDVFFAIPYSVFVYVPIGYAFWLYRADYDRMHRYTWTFFAVNLAGFITYRLFPAAPPWYVHTQGCLVDLTAPASPGAHLARVDAWLGVNYFTSVYAHSNQVFGAMPSLHAAYPLLIVFAGWGRHGRLGRAVTVGFWLWMCAAAVYLDHHWVADVTVGCIFGALVQLPVGWAFSCNEARFARPIPLRATAPTDR